MPTGPNRSGSLESMMQYTYLPRLTAAAGSIAALRPPCTTFSETERAAGRSSLRLLADTRPWPFAFPAPFAFGLLLGDSGVASFFAPRGGGEEVRAVLRPLVDAVLGIFAAPAALLRRRRLVEHATDFLDEIFRQTRFGHERVAARLARALRDARERVARQR